MENTESGSELDIDGMDGTDGIGTDMCCNSDELRKEFVTVLGTVDACREGDLSGSASPSCKGTRVQQNLLKAVNDLIVEEYHKESPPSGE